MSEKNFVTCECQNCNGHIKFGADELRKGETRRIECPHCHLETIIFLPHTGEGDSQPDNKAKRGLEESIERSENGKKPTSTKLELFVFGLVRFAAMTGSVLVLIVLIAVAKVTIQTWLPEKPNAVVSITYEAVAPVQQAGRVIQNVPETPKMAAKNTFPQPVADFLLAHVGFSLKEWLDRIKPERRHAYLDNMALVLKTANTNNLTADQMEQVVRDYSELWISENEKAPDPNAALEKQVLRASYISLGFGLLITLAVFCLILVLLATERNTRRKN